MEKEKAWNVKEDVSNRFEVACIMKRFGNQGSILLFEKIKDYKVKIMY